MLFKVINPSLLVRGLKKHLCGLMQTTQELLIQMAGTVFKFQVVAEF